MRIPPMKKLASPKVGLNNASLFFVERPASVLASPLVPYTEHQTGLCGYGRVKIYCRSHVV